MILSRDTIKKFNASLVKTCIDHIREITIIFFFSGNIYFRKKLTFLVGKSFFIMSLGAFCVLAEVLELRLLVVRNFDVESAVFGVRSPQIKTILGMITMYCHGSFHFKISSVDKIIHYEICHNVYVPDKVAASKILLAA